jgi:hypothetical protein
MPTLLAHADPAILFYSAGALGLMIHGGTLALLALLHGPRATELTWMGIYVLANLVSIGVYWWGSPLIGILLYFYCVFFLPVVGVRAILSG